MSRKPLVDLKDLGGRKTMKINYNELLGTQINPEDFADTGNLLKIEEITVTEHRKKPKRSGSMVEKYHRPNKSSDDVPLRRRGSDTERSKTKPSQHYLPEPKPQALPRRGSAPDVYNRRNKESSAMSLERKRSVVERPPIVIHEHEKTRMMFEDWSIYYENDSEDEDGNIKIEEF